ncbi:MAG: hypothetical protein WC389_18290 [Lutibacter sp.]|jgi:hypothetical protein
MSAVSVGIEMVNIYADREASDFAAKTAAEQAQLDALETDFLKSQENKSSLAISALLPDLADDLNKISTIPKTDNTEIWVILIILIVITYLILT